MSERCIHEEYFPATRHSTEEGSCLLGWEEYEDECAGCPEFFTREDAEADAADRKYDMMREEA